MKTPAHFAICLVGFSAFCSSRALADASNVLPEKWKPERFDNLIQKSPFAPATPVVTQVVAPSFAANLYLSSVAVIGDQFLIGVSSREQPSKIFLSTDQKEPGTDGITLVSVQYLEERGKSKATVKKGSETATLEFDQATLQSSAAPNPALTANQPAQMQQPIPQVNGINRAGRPRLPNGQPAWAGVTPNGAPGVPVFPGAPLVVPQNLGQPSAPVVNGRSIRIIKSRPTQ